MHLFPSPTATVAGPAEGPAPGGADRTAPDPSRAAAAATAALAALLLLPLPASAQLADADRDRGLPAGLTLPVLGAAAAEEPTALTVNPAGIGFVGGPALQYFHEGDPSARAAGDGLYLADRLGPLALGLDAEWLRPGREPLPGYRRTQLALALSDGRAASVGFGWTWIVSREGALERAGSWELGLTVRPLRQLSLAASAMGNDAHLGPARLPVRFDLSTAARLWDDHLTASADLLADDGGGQAFRTQHARLGAAWELGAGIAAGLSLDLALRDEPGLGRRPGALLSLTWNAPHAGVTAGATRFQDRSGWLAGLRLSAEAYRAAGGGRDLPSLDLPRALEPVQLLGLTVGDRDPYGLVLERLVAARDDPSVGALLLRIDAAPLGAGRIEELRSLLASIRQRKPVLAYLLGGGTREYWLASAATAVAAPPGAALLLNGLSSSQLYFRDLLGRLGVAVQVIRAGAYKSAMEPFVREGPSPEARQAADAVLDDVYGQLLADVADARRLAEARVRALVDQALFTSEEARAAGLLDAVVWPDEVAGWAQEVTGRRLREVGGYRPEPLRQAARWGRPPVVEVIRLAGIIARGSGSAGALGEDSLAGADAVAASLRRAAADGEVKAIVLRIESPGGDGFASDLVWREVVRARRSGKPVIASLGDLAASGGYLVAAGADAIVAEPATLTGSIGVFAAKPDLSGLLDRLSVRQEASDRGAKAEILSLTRPWSEPEREALQRQVDAFYALFLDRVAEGRKLPRAQVEAVAGGRVWTGRQALERKLVDRIGTLADAVAMARDRAGLSARDGAVVRRAGARSAWPVPPGFSALARAEQEPMLSRLARSAPELEALLALSEANLGPLLAMPEDWLAGQAGR